MDTCVSLQQEAIPYRRSDTATCGHGEQTNAQQKEQEERGINTLGVARVRDAESGGEARRHIESTMQSFDFFVFLTQEMSQLIDS